MNFNTPIPRTTAPKWHEGSPLRSVRDSDANATAWKRSQNSGSQSEDYGRALTKIQKELNKLKRRQTGYQIQTNFPLPFEIYNIQNSNNPALDYLTFQISGGIIGYRSSYFFNPSPYGVFEQSLDCNCTDGVGSSTNPQIPNTGPTITLANPNDTLIFDDSVDTVLPQISLNPLLDGFGLTIGSFWLKLIDDPVLGLYTQLWGREVSFDTGAYLRPSSYLPSYTDSSIIPIGSAVYSAGAEESTGSNESIYIGQYQVGNLVNRYTALAPQDSILGLPVSNRGSWVADLLSGEVFYNGDSVIDDTASISTDSSGSNFYGVYTFIGGIQTTSVNPAADSSNWEIASVVIL